MTLYELLICLRRISRFHRSPGKEPPYLGMTLRTDGSGDLFLLGAGIQGNAEICKFDNIQQFEHFLFPSDKNEIPRVFTPDLHQVCNVKVMSGYGMITRVNITFECTCGAYFHADLSGTEHPAFDQFNTHLRDVYQKEKLHADQKERKPDVPDNGHGTV